MKNFDESSQARNSLPTAAPCLCDSVVKNFELVGGKFGNGKPEMNSQVVGRRARGRRDERKGDAMQRQISNLKSQIQNLKSHIPHPPTAYRLPPAASSRRGVLILVVLSLLVMFALMSMTYVLLASKQLSSAKSNARTQANAGSPQGEIEAAAAELFRDTVNPHSSLYDHSLLNDLYGDGIKGVITAGTKIANQQLDRLAATIAIVSGQEFIIEEGCFNGCILTVTSGRARGLSTRVVKSLHGVLVSNTVTLDLDIVPFKSASGPINITTDVSNQSFIINGRPYGGTGFGFDPTAPTSPLLMLQAAVGRASTVDIPIALLPNHKQRPAGGNANEDYDAVDFQNMALAWLPPNLHLLPPTPNPIIPSFHRPALVRYMENAYNSSVWNDADDPNVLKRKVLLRPIGPMTIVPANQADHPNFTGSNPNPAGFDPINGPWDVDNDGDGVPDSVWIDLGFPVRTMLDGRKYKPLIAFLVVDLDGRVNVNAHGNQKQALTAYEMAANNVPGYFADASGSNLPRGRGFGPADIYPGTLLSDASIAQTVRQGFIANLLQGNATLEGRHGEFGTANAEPGRTNLDDPFSRLKLFEFPPVSFQLVPPAGPMTSFMTPPDVWGQRVVGLDYRGQPVFSGFGGNPVNLANTADPLWQQHWNNETLDDPYELDLSRDAPRLTTGSSVPADSPFSIYELERLLRPYDIDTTTLPLRLAGLIEDSLTSVSAAIRLQTLNAIPKQVTTESFSIPAPTPAVPENFSASANLPTQNRAYHIQDLLRAKLITGRGYAKPLTPAQEDEISADVNQMLSWDLLLGKKMNINRPLGDGRDGNGNFVVDELLATEISTEGNYGQWADVFQTALNFDLVNGSTYEGTDTGTRLQNVMARQLLARHLYVLMLLLCDEQYDKVAVPGNPNLVNDLNQFKHRIAQWAINVVDFRDADSIMTPFEFDLNPWNGWDVDGDLTSDEGPAIRGVVWGCERPEMLLTEAFAFHDRRTEDLSTGGQVPDDPHFDQRLRPRSGLFVELYNPWTDQHTPAEFYNRNHTQGGWEQGIVLDKTGDSPVWRLLVVNSEKDPDSPDDRPTAAEIERSVYFINDANSVGAITGDGKKYCQSQAQLPVLQPGHYAIVGSAVEREGNKYITALGRRTGHIEGTTDALTRRFVLDPTNATNGFLFENNGNSEPDPADILPVIGIPIDRKVVGNVANPASLSISEPLSDYPDTLPGGEVWDPTLAGGEGAYNPVVDEPLDFNDAILKTNGVQPYRRIHLQRLANPLLAWNATTNPYRTIDAIAVNLTTFNGVTDSATVSEPGAIGQNSDPDGRNPDKFATNQRGDQETTIRNIWHHDHYTNPIIPLADSPTDTTHVMDRKLVHSLGFLNTAYQPAFTQATAPATPYYLGVPDNSRAPFPWLAWNDRPFNSIYELMNVPASSAYRLSYEFSVIDNSTAGNPYGSDALDIAGYRHLLNFFHALKPAGQAAHFYRVFDYLEVPSPFVNTDLVLSPQAILGLSPYSSAPALDQTQYLQPPFNTVPDFRDPGRVNINTITSREVWNAVLGGMTGTSWDEFSASRRGSGVVSDPLYPTEFANPFRGIGGADMVPPLEGGNVTRMTRDKAVNATLLRAGRTRQGAIEQPHDPDNAANEAPLLMNTTAVAANPAYHTDGDRNPYFRYQGLDRIGNLVTTQSNVYAVWITVGYFEVEPHAHPTLLAGPNAVYPDGYWLGQELGADTGEINRHRGFYIFDRSIPVGYERGQDHNVQDAVLLRRFIE